MIEISFDAQPGYVIIRVPVADWPPLLMPELEKADVDGLVYTELYILCRKSVGSGFDAIISANRLEEALFLTAFATWRELRPKETA